MIKKILVLFSILGIVVIPILPKKIRAASISNNGSSYIVLHESGLIDNVYGSEFKVLNFEDYVSDIPINVVYYSNSSFLVAESHDFYLTADDTDYGIYSSLLNAWGYRASNDLLTMFNYSSHESTFIEYYFSFIYESTIPFSPIVRYHYSNDPGYYYTQDFGLVHRVELRYYFRNNITQSGGYSFVNSNESYGRTVLWGYNYDTDTNAAIELPESYFNNERYDSLLVRYDYTQNSDYLIGVADGKRQGLQLGEELGFENARSTFGKLVDDVWRTADEYGHYRFLEGYDKGLNTEIAWYEWAFTFITMPVRILNIEVLPGIKIGYFALFTLMTGIVSWFFFIVGKGKK